MSLSVLWVRRRMGYEYREPEMWGCNVNQEVSLRQSGDGTMGKLNVELLVPNGGIWYLLGDPQGTAKLASRSCRRTQQEVLLIACQGGHLSLVCASPPGQARGHATTR